MGKPLAMGKGERFNNGQAPLRVAMGCEWGLGGGGGEGGERERSNLLKRLHGIWEEGAF